MRLLPGPLAVTACPLAAARRSILGAEGERSPPKREWGDPPWTL